MPTPNRRKLSTAIATFITAQTVTPSDVMVRPSAAPERTDEMRSAYSIVYPLPGVQYFGDLDDPESMVGWQYQITAFGVRPDQAQWLDDKIREAIMTRGVGVAFANPIVAADCVVVDRSVLDSGAAVPSDDSVFAVQSTYQMKAVTA